MMYSRAPIWAFLMLFAAGVSAQDLTLEGAGAEFLTGANDLDRAEIDMNEESGELGREIGEAVALDGDEPAEEEAAEEKAPTDEELQEDPEPESALRVGSDGSIGYDATASSNLVPESALDNQIGNDGSFRYQVAIGTPSYRGLVPNLALNYNSGQRG